MRAKRQCQWNILHNFFKLVVLFSTKLATGALGNCIEVHGDWLPRHIFGKCTAFCAIVRMFYLSLVLVSRHLMRRVKCCIGQFFGHVVTFETDEIVLMDGVSASLPLFYLAGIPSIFYCHFPDKVSDKIRVVGTVLYSQKSSCYFAQIQLKNMTASAIMYRA